MKITIKIKGKKVSQKKAKEQYGEELISRRIAEAKEEYFIDPMKLVSWMDGMEIIVAER